MSSLDPKQNDTGRPSKPAEQSPAPEAAWEGVKDPNTLTPEEQMARYEESLKEDDWGHQPC